MSHPSVQCPTEEPSKPPGFVPKKAQGGQPSAGQRLLSIPRNGRKEVEGKRAEGGLPRTLRWHLISQTRPLATVSCRGAGCQAPKCLSLSSRAEKGGWGSARRQAGPPP